MQPHEYELLDPWSRAGDDDLVRLARADTSHPALRLLLVRHRGWMRGVILRQGRRLGLTAQQLGDAQEEVVVPLLAAVASYQPPRRGRGGNFPGFLAFVIFRWLAKRAARRHAAEHHLDRSVGAAEALDERVRQEQADRRQDPIWGGPTDDPAALAVRAELCQRVGALLHDLNEADRRLLQGVGSGVPLVCLARELGVSLSTARRWRQRVLSELAERLRDERPEGQRPA